MHQIGRYHLERELGRGAMGIVYAGFDPVLKRRVAVKTFQPPNGSSDQPWEVMGKRLAREAQSAAGLNHPNIVNVYDVVEESGILYVVMEFIDGKSLAQTFPTGTPVPAGPIVRPLQECASGLDYAHGQGVVHRDVKPANIMLDKSGVTKIADFGLAKLMDSTTDLTQGFVLGTLEYMAPDQLHGRSADGRADQYALAVVAYGLLTGSRIHDADTVARWCHLVVSESPTPATARNPNLPPNVDPVFARALAKTPEARFESCSRFVLDLSRALNAHADAMPTVVTVPRPPVEAVPDRRGRLKWAVPGILAAVVVGVAIYAWERHVPIPKPIEDQKPVEKSAKVETAVAPTQVSPASTPNPDLAREAWDRVKGSSNRLALEAFLKAYATSEYVGLARVELALLPPPVVAAKPVPSVGPRLGEEKANLTDAQRYVWIPPGKFTMGCSPQDNQCSDDEKPAHPVEITKGFWMAQTAVPLASWQRYRTITGAAALPGQDNTGRKINGSTNDASAPIVAIDWDRAQAFCKWAGGRLPTESEWEYAARAGSVQARYGEIDSIAWYADNAGRQRFDSYALLRLTREARDRALLENGNGPRPVGQKRPNAWNVYDMLGNVSQWTSDWYGESYYRESPSHDPAGPADGKDRVTRGGSWFHGSRAIRASARLPIPKGEVRSGLGVRCVLD
jgi:serine/threonine-protein kinase